jgi:N-acetylglucosamine-6-phosphate deacetylase
MTALRATDSCPAVALKVDADHGTIQSGKYADMM